jgi:HSP20 family protein
MNYLTREMDRLLDDFWAPPRNTRNLQEMEAKWNPPCDVEEADDHYLISLEMAGVPKEQIKIECHDNQILISGERRQESKKKEEGKWYTERRYGKFQRAFTLPAGVEADKVEANYHDGILRVYVPKTEVPQPRQIKITNGPGGGFLSKLLGSTTESKSDQVA